MNVLKCTKQNKMKNYQTRNKNRKTKTLSLNKL